MTVTRPALRERVEVFGDATLYLADARELLPTLAQADAVITDPPYGILNLAGSGSTPAVRKSPRQQGSGTLKNRLLNRSDVRWDVAPNADAIAALRAAAPVQIIWGGNYFALPPARAMLVWDKVQPWENFSQVELAWTNLEQPAGLFRWRAVDVDGKEHPTQKPLPLMHWCLRRARMPRLTIDPYMGSGTTGVACIELGLSFVGVEVDPASFDMACRRIERARRQETLFAVEQVAQQDGLFAEAAA